MTSPPHQGYQRPFISRKSIRPLRDALLAGLVVFGCFAGSALWIYFKARSNEIAHHREVIETAAWRAAEGVDPGILRGNDLNQSDGSDGASTLAKLRAIEEKESPVARVTLLRPSGNEHLVIYDSDLTKKNPEREWLVNPDRAEKLALEEVAVAAEVLQKATRRTVTRRDGTVKSYAPILSGSGAVVGVATAESAPHTLAAGLSSIGWAAFSALVVGALLAVAACLGVFSSRLKSQRAVERLARAERADHLIVETMGQIFYEHDPASDKIAWRGDVERLIGVPAAALPAGLDWQERIHPSDREAFRTARERSVAEGNHFSVEYRLRREDGHFIWLLDRGGYLPGDEDTNASVIGVILDISASREAEERLRDVVDAAGEYIWEVNEEGRYIYISDRVMEVLGRTPEEMLGREPFDFVPAEDIVAVREASELVVDKREAFRDFEHRITCADGRVIWLSVNGVPSFNADGVWSGYRGAGLDVTSRKEAEQALIREKEAANAAVRTKSQFLAMMSHEIRTPLNSVLGFADLLSGTSLDREQKEQVELIRRSGDALLVLLNDILDFSRIESAGLALDVSDVDVKACLKEVMDLYRPSASARNLALSLKVDEGVPPLVRTDKARLRQILLNLVGNAVKFTDSGSVGVRVKMNPRPAADGKVSLCIEISDTGIGIPREKVELLFQPFSQVDSSATRRFGGTGLGLAICRRLAELLGSEVCLLQSGPEGSIFQLNLNVVESSEATTAATLVQSGTISFDARKSAGARRVLVVEDNRVNRLLVRKMLTSFNVSSDEAENGRECVHMHGISPYDVILMDVQMPFLDGVEATRLIRQNEKLKPETSHAVIIALTADAMIGDRERCLDAGMDDYLSKPIRTHALALILEKYGLLIREEPTSGEPKNL